MIQGILMYQVRCSHGDCAAQGTPDMGFLDAAVAEADAEDNGWQIVRTARPSSRGIHFCPEHRVCTTCTCDTPPGDATIPHREWCDGDQQPCPDCTTSSMRG